ncbi:unnamed protein product [Trichogramma brassicae]|uniref:Peptidase aspartic putative domain-containing protein n=1 Tax=Trichogramma brassicae TaxID=86971 RepID=A0A6H5IAA5_9HYME|nr:unnamed protein product [Trichogramma brassicae]
MSSRQSTTNLNQVAQLLSLIMSTSLKVLCVLRERGYQHISFKLVVLKEKLVLNGKFIDKHGSCSSSAHPSSTRPKLPEIKLINFSGSYADWPAYKEMFTTMVAENNHLTNVEKLHYLRGSLSKEPLQLIQGLHLSGDSLAAAWDMLSKRYENKRYIIQSYLDMLSNTAPAQHRKTLPLSTRSRSALQKARQALLTLTDKEKLADLMFVSQLVRLLDRQTKEAWETHIMNFTEECSFDQLYEFLVSRIRAIERVDGKESASTSHIHAFKAGEGTRRHSQAWANLTDQLIESSSHLQTRQVLSLFSMSGARPLHCHVSALQERLNTGAKKNVVVNERLCYNCLGRDSVRNCRSSIRCKVCGQSHNTMIHPEDDKSKQTDTNTAKLSHHGFVQSQGSSLLATAMSYIVHSHGTQPVRILIDPGSEVSFVTSHIVNSLALKRERTHLCRSQA